MWRTFKKYDFYALFALKNMYGLEFIQDLLF